MEKDAAEVATIREPENAAIEFQGDVHVHVVWRAIRFSDQFPCGGKPKKLSIEAKMQDEEATVEFEEQVLSVSRHPTDRSPFGGCRNERRFLWHGGNRMKNMDAADLLAADHRAKRLCDRFDFRELRHRVRALRKRVSA